MKIRGNYEPKPPKPKQSNKIEYIYIYKKLLKFLKGTNLQIPHVEVKVQIPT